MKQLLVLITFAFLNSQPTHADGLLPVEYIGGGNNYNNGTNYVPPANNNYVPPQTGYRPGYGGNQRYQQGPVCLDRVSVGGNLILPQDIAVDLYATRGYCVTNTACDFRQNPHSYACTTVTFNGSIFPFYGIDWNAWQSDSWVSVTYVNPNGHRGNEFFMQQNPNNPRQPMGVYNSRDGAPMGRMWIGRDHTLLIENWNGIRNIIFDVARENYDNGEVQWIWWPPQGYRAAPQLLTCRDFNRNNKHHVLCAWDEGTYNGGWSHRGYIGFLSTRDWNGFRPDGR